MKKKMWEGTITVFLSMVCMLFLALICAATESARIQGAKMQSANITGMGTFSLLSEFEKELLEEYEIFSLDAGSGGSFQIQKVNASLEKYLSWNTNPKDGLLKSLAFDPWNLHLQEGKVTGYALLTDDHGEPFYQQAVSYMTANTGFAVVEELLKLSDTQEIIRNQASYETELQSSDQQMADMKAESEKTESEKEEAQGETAAAVAESVENPLPVIEELRKKNLLDLLAWDKAVSEKKITLREQPSHSRLKSGTFSIEKEHSGLYSDALFRGYLAGFFPNYTSGKTGAALDYQLEYILGGKMSDRKNLQHAVDCLLALRSGMNFAYCSTNPAMTASADALAAALTMGIPVAFTIVKYALLLAWAFGESLMDLRILLDGGKIPLKKDETTWSLSLQNLARVTEIMAQGGKSRNSGLSYVQYLTVLLFMGNLKNQRMRALDLIQAEMRKKEGMSSFKVENCIVAVRTSATYQCRPVFFGLPQAVVGTAGTDLTFTQTASMAY